MQFSHSLMYNAVTEWQNNYIDYEHLKKLIYTMQSEEFKMKTSPPESRIGSSMQLHKIMRFGKKEQTVEKTVELTDLENGSSTTVNDESREVFVNRLYEEKAKIESFYNSKEESIFQKYETLENDLKRDVAESHHVVQDEDEEDDDDHTHHDSALIGHVDAEQQKITILKRRTSEIYIMVSQLKSFVELNKIGFFKISKKFDKTLDSNIRPSLMDNDVFFEDCHVFDPKTMDVLDSKLDVLISIYSSLTGLSPHDCKGELRSKLRDHIVWERNTVWKDMIAGESQNNNIKATESLGDDTLALDYFRYVFDKPIDLKFMTINQVMIPKLFFGARALKIFIICIITMILLVVKTFHDEAQHRCMALVACVALLWATEAIPLFVTALLVPFLAVLFRVMKDTKGNVQPAAAAGSALFASMWSSTIMVLIAGFTLAAALSKYNIAKVLASWILSAAGQKPRNVLLAIMGVVFFLSMWISNVAAPVLTYSLSQSLLRNLDVDDAFAKALILAVAFAANVGGLASPISSPQNVIAMNYLKQYNVGWGQFFAISIPVAIVTILLIWCLMMLTFKIHKTKIVKFKPIKERFTLKQWYILAVTLGTILLWCVLTQIEDAFGNAGVIAVFPIALFFGTGLLTTQDINNFPWSIVLLAMGGSALGTAVSSSGLLSHIALALEKRVLHYSAYVVLIIFGGIMLVFGTFVSHTVSAIIIIPLVQEVGDKLPAGNAGAILVFGCTLLASGGMGLPSSGFPNVTAISMTDELGRRYLDVGTFISRGVPASILMYIVVITVGYGIMSSVLH